MYFIYELNDYCFNTVPNPPLNIKQNTNDNDTNVNIQWDIPWIFNCKLQKFTINVTKSSLKDNKTSDHYITKDIEVNENLLPTYNYTVTHFI